MDTSITACSYSNPLHADGTIANDTITAFQFASSTCTTIGTSTPATTTVSVSLARGDSAENPLVTQDSGSLVWGLALIIFILSFAVLGTIFRSKT